MQGALIEGLVFSWSRRDSSTWAVTVMLLHRVQFGATVSENKEHMFLIGRQSAKDLSLPPRQECFKSLDMLTVPD